MRPARIRRCVESLMVLRRHHPGFFEGDMIAETGVCELTCRELN